jgi:multiple sugar transport system permease protein
VKLYHSPDNLWFCLALKITKMSETLGRKTPWLPRWFTSENPLPWLLPASALMIVLGVYPLLWAIYHSLFRRNAATRRLMWDPDWNWAKALGDERVWGALSNTLIYTGVALFFQVMLGMGIALLLDSDRKGYGVMRAIMTLPMVIPPAVTAMMFLMMLNGSFGVIAQGIIGVGLLPENFSILGDSSTALAGVLLAEIWQWTPFMVLIMLAGLRSLPKEPFEAAAIDGASHVQAFFKLTLPMMSKVIGIAVLIRGVDLLRAFDYVKVMTDSGPGTATETLSSYAGRIYFGGNPDGPYAATIALITLVVVIVTSTLFMRIFKVKL